jgi:hypothetical protein
MGAWPWPWKDAQFLDIEVDASNPDANAFARSKGLRVRLESQQVLEADRLDLGC